MGTLLVFDVPALVPIAVGVTVAAVIVVLLRRWATRNGWDDRHRIALATGVVLSGILYGFSAIRYNETTLLGRVIVSVAILGLIAIVNWSVHHRQRSAQ